MNDPTLARIVMQYPLLALAAGLIIWLLGWRISKIFIVIAGVFIGAHLALRFSYLPLFQNLPHMLLMVGGGILGGVLAFMALYVMFFFLGVTIGYEMVAASFNQHVEVLGLLVGIALGLAFVILFKIFIVVATSFVGSVLILDATMLLTATSLGRLLYLTALAALTAAGVVLQYQVWGPPRSAKTVAVKESQ